MEQRIEKFHIDELFFDPQNPRFAALDFDKTDDKKVIELMLKEETLADLIISIVEQGFFQGEPLLVFEDEKTKKKIVAEGNRRLSALKIIQNPEISNKKSIIEIVEKSKRVINEVPCLLFDSRNDILVYLGFKHITGIKEWGALEKAIYLDQLKSYILSKNNELDEADLHKLLARKIGSKSNIVGRTLTAYEIYKRGTNNGEDKIFFGLQGVDKTQVEFSLIYTALSSENIYRYLGLSSSVDTVLADFNREHATDLFRWLFKQDEYGKTAVPESRKLKELSKILGSPEATIHFKNTNDLDTAYRLSSGPSNAFEELLRNIIRDQKLLQQLFTEIRNDILENKSTFRFTKKHSVDIEDLGRAFRDLEDDSDRLDRNLQINQG